jgi:hypothetical protein
VDQEAAVHPEATVDQEAAQDRERERQTERQTRKSPCFLALVALKAVGCAWLG